MPTSIIWGKYLIAKATSRTEALVIEDGALFQRDGVIVEVGSRGDLRRRYAADDIIGSERHVVMPGLVNAHHHVGLTPFQLGSPDYPLELWLVSRFPARNVDPYLDTLYSAFEMIESGVTTVQHLAGMRGPKAQWPGGAAAILRAYRDIGMRVSYAFGIRDQNRVVYGSDGDFIRQLPSDLAPDVQAWVNNMSISFDDYAKDLFIGLLEISGRNREERVRIWLAPANLHWCSDALLLRIKELASEYHVGMHMHLLETIYQKMYSLRQFDMTPVRHLRELGLLGPELTLGHGVWLTEDDLDIIGSTGTCICHNPSSNLRLQSGIAPVNAWLERNMRVALGMDEAGINDDRDMLQEMRLALKLHRIPGLDQTVPTGPEILRMATEHGAHTTGFGNRIGVLEPGRAADVVLVNLRNVEEPYLASGVPVLDAVLHRGRSVDVDTVLIGGDVVMRDRRFTRVDKQSILQELSMSLQAPLQPEEARRRVVGKQLLPYVKAFYRNWSLEKIEPYYKRNARA
jgi:cytosine/adenosine deaminase-related metal-dependent hydrolase